MDFSFHIMSRAVQYSTVQVQVHVKVQVQVPVPMFREDFQPLCSVWPKQNWGEGSL